MPGLVIASKEVGAPENPASRHTQFFDPAKLGASAVFDVAGTPCAYFRLIDAAHADDEELSRLHRMAWNYGAAPLLYVVTPTRVDILNAYAMPRGESGEWKQHRLHSFHTTIEDLKKLSDILGHYELASGQFWARQDATRIRRKHRVDQCLLNDLQAAEQQLTSNGLTPTASHAILCRLLFAAYLSDRRILSPQFFRRRFNIADWRDLLTSRRRIRAFFAFLADTFHGDLFEDTASRQDASATSLLTSLTDTHLAVIHAFFLGVEMRTGQGRLWPYRFDVMPIELISSVYEMFVHNTSGADADEQSTNYTPAPLANFALTQALDDLPPNVRVADLSCGSGVFLVEALRRLTAKAITAGRPFDRTVARDVLRNQIFGVDAEPQAVQIATLSLYLTLLELDPDPQPPSKLRFEPLLNRNLFCADALDVDEEFNSREPFLSQRFDLIIGNPPWTKTSTQVSVRGYCHSVGWPNWRDAPDQAFVRRALDFAKPGGRVAMFINARTLFANSPLSRLATSRLFAETTPELVLNLSQLRTDQLFPTSTQPCVFIVFKHSASTSDSTFTFASANWTPHFRNHGLLPLIPFSVQRLKAESIARRPYRLKILCYGSLRDVHLIERLQQDLPTLEDVLHSLGCEYSQGFIRGTVRHSSAAHLRGLPEVPVDELLPYQLTPSRYPTFRGSMLERSRDAALFRPPLLLVQKNQRTDDAALRVRASLSTRAVAFSESFFGISFHGVGMPQARALHAILNSTICTYLLCMTAPTWGIYRDEIKPDELKKLSVPRLHSLTNEQLRELSNADQELCSASGLGQLSALARIDQVVAAMYGLDQEELGIVTDFVTYKLSARLQKRQSPAFMRPDLGQLCQYAEVLVSEVQTVLNTLDQRSVVAVVFGHDDYPLAAVELQVYDDKARGPAVQVATITQRNAARDLLQRDPQDRVLELLRTRGEVRITSEDSVVLVKTAERQRWSMSEAVTDAGAILSNCLRP